MEDPISLVKALIALPGPSGQEEAVAADLVRRVGDLGLEAEVDPKGNVLVRPARSGASAPRVVVTAHMDELALMVTAVEVDGTLSVSPLGGALLWKWGEQPVEVLADTGALPGVLSLGCIHTDAPGSVPVQARTSPLRWDQAFVFTGLDEFTLEERGVRPGTRVVLAPEARTLREMGEHVSGRFLDDRADIAAWLLALEQVRDSPIRVDVLFAATTSEEVGGEGALYLMRRVQPDLCIALEHGPTVPESPFPVDATPTVWVRDSYAAMAPADLAVVARVAGELGLELHWQSLSRAGSDASVSAGQGLIARPVTLGFPIENSHGLEIMHRDAVANLANLLVAYLRALPA